ncbi:MAG: glycyl-tRNA ligase subunit beta [Pseudomonadota bacterium]|jgi:glycyl-tRNA synthetase beta chain
MNKNPLLIELFTEELPPKALLKLADAFALNIHTQLQNLGLADESSSYEQFATPRRLAVRVSDVLEQAQDKQQNLRLMPASVGLVNGDKNARSVALVKKLASLGLDESVALNIVSDGKQDYLSVDYTTKGVMLADELSKILQDTINKLPVPKVMSYQLKCGETVNFVRPAHNLLCLHGDKVVDASILGLQSNNITYGHRFLSNTKNSITINHASEYENLLEQSFVIADYNKRLEIIKQQLKTKADELKAQEIAPESLLHEVNSLVEYPCVYVGEFEEKFLQVPDECLILTMQSHQKYFALQKDNKLINKFLFVSNMKADDPKNIIQGNQKVIRPRLSDAEFFFNEDKKHRLDSKIEELKKVTYHNKLGSQYDRMQRVSAIIGILCDNNLNLFVDDRSNAMKAAELCKVDLLSNMVGEFPELQGIMGNYYALNDGENEEIANSIAEHYKPKFASDSLPDNNVSILLALADKLETLVGIWGIGLKPTGEKDPYALRRHALGIMRIITEKNLPINLKYILKGTAEKFKDNIQHNTEDIHNFCFERLANYLKNTYDASIVDAVLEREILENIDDRLKALSTYKSNPQLISLIASNKRIHNILKKQNDINNDSYYNPDATYLQLIDEEKGEEENYERKLNKVYKSKKSQMREYHANKQYTDLVSSLAEFADPLEKFFANIMVNDNDLEIRNNKMALLAKIHYIFNEAWDLTKLT